MAQDRFFRGAPVSSGSLNKMAEELDYQGLACSVRRSAPEENQSAAVDRIITWQVEDIDTFGGGMWDPAAPQYVVARVDGMYLIDSQLRFIYGSGAYQTGYRAAKLLVNSTNVLSTDPTAGPVKTDIREATTISSEGTTLSLTRVYPLFQGDRVYVAWWHNASGNLQTLHQDFGGTFLSVSRLGPLL